MAKRFLTGLVVIILIIAVIFPTTIQAASAPTNSQSLVCYDSSSLLSTLQQCGNMNITIRISGTRTYSGGYVPNGKVTDATQLVIDTQLRNIVWSGTSFSDQLLQLGYTLTCSGTVSADGSNISSLILNTKSGPDNVGNSEQKNVTLSNVPIQWPQHFDISSGSLQTDYKGAAVSSYVTSTSYTGTLYDPSAWGHYTESMADWNYNDSGNLIEIVFLYPGQVTATTPSTNAPPVTTTSSSDDSLVHVSALTGQVEYCLPQADHTKLSSWHMLRMGTALPKDTYIKTAEDSSVVLSCADMSTFVLKPESEIQLTGPAEKEGKLRMLAGDLWANVKKMVKDGNMEVEMTQAVAGIKGTTFVMHETGTESTLKVIEGQVAFTSDFNGTVQQVATGQMATDSGKGTSTIKTFDVTAEQNDWNTVIATTNSAPTKSSGNNTLILIIVAAVAVIVVITLIAVLRKNKKAAKS